MEPPALPPPGAAAAATTPVVIEPDPDVERGLRASVKVLDFAKERLNALGDHAEGVPVTTTDLVMLKRAAIAMNNSLTRVLKKNNAVEACTDRLLLEIHLIRQTMAKELTDRNANRARVFEQIRRYQGDEEGSSIVNAAPAAHHSNPLLAPSQAQLSVDRALASVARIDQSMATLNPNGTTAVHGAGLIAAHNACMAVAEPAV